MMNAIQTTVVCISGMPASGKDTISARLHELDERFVCFEKHRSSDGAPKNGYVNISPAEFAEKVKRGDFLQYHERYGRSYGIDRKSLFDILSQGKIPIIHVGRIENYIVLKDGLLHGENGIRLIHIQLWETEDCLKDRIVKRDKSPEEIKRRLTALRQEFEEVKALMDGNAHPFDLIVKNSDIEETCRKIKGVVFDGRTADDGAICFREYLRTMGEKME